MEKFKLFCLAIALMLEIASAHAQICPPVNVTAPGIGDGCTTSGAQYVLPDIGIFRSTFTTACDKHDKCYATIGMGINECNDAFRSNLLTACRNSFNPVFRPVEYVACFDTAQRYYGAVLAWSVTNPAMAIQSVNSLAASRALETAVSTFESCGTTPERTTLYSQRTIDKINNLFLTYRYRKPSIYEFLAAVNNTSGISNVVTDPAAWESRVIAQVNSSAVPISLPSVDFSNSLPLGGGQLAVLNPNAAYTWKTNVTADQYGPVFFIDSSYPMWDVRYSLNGILKARFGNIRNMAVIDTYVFEQGWCGPQAGPYINCN